MEGFCAEDKEGQTREGRGKGWGEGGEGRREGMPAERGTGGGEKMRQRLMGRKGEN